MFLTLNIYSPLGIPVQQPAVGLNLHLQAGLDAQQTLVVRILALSVGPHLLELLLQAAYKLLHLRQLAAVGALGFSQRAFQGRLLQVGERQSRVGIRKQEASPRSSIQWKQRFLGTLKKVPSFCARLLPYHGELGLEFNFQVLQQALQVGDLALAGLKLLGVGADFFSELSTLQQPSGQMG